MADEQQPTQAEMRRFAIMKLALMDDQVAARQIAEEAYYGDERAEVLRGIERYRRENVRRAH